MDVVIPVNTKANVFIPTKDAASITENGIPLSQLSDLKVVGNKDGYVEVSLGSGHYQFVSNF
jgi:alpha-L-rhamnosidase